MPRVASPRWTGNASLTPWIRNSSTPEVCLTYFGPHFLGIDLWVVFADMAARCAGILCVFRVKAAQVFEPECHQMSHFRVMGRNLR